MRSAFIAFEAKLNLIVLVAAMLCLALASCLGLYQVLTRFVLGIPSDWTEELIRISLIWMVFLGCAAAFRHGALVSIDLMHRKSRGLWRKIVEGFITIASLTLLSVMLWYGVMIAWRVRFQVFPGLDVSVGWGYLAIPVGALFCILAVLAHYLDTKWEEAELEAAL